MNKPDLKYDFNALRDRIEDWADEEHDYLNRQERDASDTDGNFDSFNGQHRTVDEKQDALLKQLGKANDARSRGNLDRYREIVEAVVATIDLGEDGAAAYLVKPEAPPSVATDTGEERVARSPSLLSKFIAFVAGTPKPSTSPERSPVPDPAPDPAKDTRQPEPLIDGEHIEPSPSGRSDTPMAPATAPLPSSPKYDRLRAAASRREARESVAHGQRIEGRLEDMGYETDSIGLSEALGAKAIDDEYDAVMALIEKAEAAERSGRKRQASKLSREVETRLARDLEFIDEQARGLDDDAC